MFETFVSVTCAHCTVVFGMPVEMERRRRNDGLPFQCPSGHENVFRPSELEKARKEIEALKLRIEQQDGSLNFLREQAARPVYRCIVAGCDHRSGTKSGLRKHLERDHGFAQRQPLQLPADAGPSN